ncbi:MAG: hypothetical protein FWF24_05025 [Alphaproteobacteria bacterium]|nr:hypothetical protein [Alphaproteobacteria bacterium]
MAKAQQQNIILELSAVIVGIKKGQPHIMVAQGNHLPAGPLQTNHRKLEQALRVWVKAQVGLNLGYVEQLYTFADKDRLADGQRVISIGYLALTRHMPTQGTVAWYDFLPWEDHRDGMASVLPLIQSRLRDWEKQAPTPALRAVRRARTGLHFPLQPRLWHEELVLQRYELLWEAGLLPESRHKQKGALLPAGLAMAQDHRRILATAMARLRAKIKYRPVVFELMEDHFTLLQLQNTLEALAGVRLHKQNFRRLVLHEGLLEALPTQLQQGRGRPAHYYAFRREVLDARAMVGTKLPRAG